jgi:hypothetical protein
MMSEKPPSPSRIAAAKLKRTTAKKLKRELDPEIDRLADSRPVRPRQSTRKTPGVLGDLALISAKRHDDADTYYLREGRSIFGGSVDDALTPPVGFLQFFRAKPAASQVRALQEQVAERLSRKYPTAGLKDVHLHAFDDPELGKWHWLITLKAAAPRVMDALDIQDELADLLGHDANNVVKLYPAD